MISVRVLSNLKGNLNSRRSGGYPNGVEVTLLDGSRKHFLPSELELVGAAAEATLASAPRLQQRLHLDGPYKGYEDIDFSVEANPESFVVSLTACGGLKAALRQP